MLKGTSPDGQHYYPAFPYTSYQRMRTERRARPVRLHEDAAGGVRQGPRPRPAVPVQRPAHARRLEVPVPRRQAVHAGPDQAGDLEPRRLSGQRPGPLRRMPSARAMLLGGIVADQRFAGGPDPEGGDGWVPNITQEGLGKYCREGDRDRPRRPATLPERRFGRRRHGQGGRATPRNCRSADRAAMAAYIKSLPPVAGPKRRAAA